MILLRKVLTWCRVFLFETTPKKRAAIFIAALLSLDFRLLSFAEITSQSFLWKLTTMLRSDINFPFSTFSFQFSTELVEFGTDLVRSMYEGCSYGLTQIIYPRMGAKFALLFILSPCIASIGTYLFRTWQELDRKLTRRWQELGRKLNFYRWLCMMSFIK